MHAIVLYHSGSETCMPPVIIMSEAAVLWLYPYKWFSLKPGGEPKHPVGAQHP